MVDKIILSLAFAFMQVLYVRSQCGGTPQAITVNLLETYTLETPGFPTGYIPSLSCVWTADVSSSVYALLFQVVKSELGCPGDGITVEDVLSGTKKLDKYCESGEASSFISIIESGKVRITFTSDANSKSSEKGLQVLLYTVPKSNDATCIASRTLQAKESQDTILLSPNFPVSYPNNVLCAWKIEAPSGYTTKLTLYFEDIEADASCQFDYIEIKTNSKVFTKTCKEWSFSKTSSATFDSNDTITVVLKSDDETTKRGFMFVYRAVEKDQTNTTIATATTITTTVTTSTFAATATSTSEETATTITSSDYTSDSASTVVPVSGNSKNDSKDYTNIAEVAIADHTTLEYELNSTVTASSQTGTINMIEMTDKDVRTTVGSDQITTSSEITSPVASTVTIGKSLDKLATDEDKIMRTTLVTELSSITKSSKVKSVGTTDTLTFRGGNDTVCSLKGCVVPLVVAISLLLGTLFLCLVILGSTRWRKRTRKYEITPRTKTESCKTQAVLPSVKELSDEECSL